MSFTITQWDPSRKRLAYKFSGAPEMHPGLICIDVSARRSAQLSARLVDDAHCWQGMLDGVIKLWRVPAVIAVCLSFAGLRGSCAVGENKKRTDLRGSPHPLPAICVLTRTKRRARLRCRHLRWGQFAVRHFACQATEERQSSARCDACGPQLNIRERQMKGRQANAYPSESPRWCAGLLHPWDPHYLPWITMDYVNLQYIKEERIPWLRFSSGAQWN